MAGMTTKVFGVLVIVCGLACLYGSTKLETHIARTFLAATAFGLFSGGANLIKVGRRQEQPPADELMTKDPRPPVFLLRAFGRDNESVRVPFRLKNSNMLSSSYYMSRADTTAEELLVKKLQELGPVVALGRSSEHLQPLGASRSYVPDTVWQQSFRDILDRAVLVVMIVDDTTALKWELEEISLAGKLSRLILILSRRAFAAWSLDVGKDLDAWEKLRESFSFLPKVSASTVAILFDEADRPSQFKSVNGAITEYASLAGA